MKMHTRKSLLSSAADDEKVQSLVYGNTPHCSSASIPAKNSMSPVLNRRGSVSRQSIGNTTSVPMSGNSANVIDSTQPIGDAAERTMP